MATLQPGEKARMYALGKIMRGGASRGGYVSGAVFISIDGIHIGFAPAAGFYGVLVGSLSIEDVLDETPNTCRFTVTAVVPPAGSEVIITRGSKNSLSRLFAGFALTVEQRYLSVPRNVVADVTCVDYTWLLGFVKVTQRYQQMGAAAIAVNLIDTYAADRGFTHLAVLEALPAIDDITFTNENLDEALTRLARRVGGYWYVDYLKDLHLFIEETTSWDPGPLIPTHPSFTDLTVTAERTQVLTRVYCEGLGSSVLVPVPAGETRVPVQTAEMFKPPAADVFIKVSPQGSEGGGQSFLYTGVVSGGGGCLVGPGIGPTTAPTLALAAGAGVDSGTHSYVVRFKTAAGESLPSPVATIANVGVGVPNPTAKPLDPWNSPDSGAGIISSTVPIGAICYVAYAYSTAPTATALTALTLASVSTNAVLTIAANDPLFPGNSRAIYTKVPYSADPRVTYIQVFLSVNGVWGAQTAYPLANQAAYGEQGIWAQMIFYAQPPTSGLPTSNTTASQNRVALSGIPVYTPGGGGTVTGRTLYRTAANQSQLKLLTTIADNTTTTYTDSTADAALGANLVPGDTSALQQPAGQVLPGSTSLIVAATPPFDEGGGWAIIGNGEQVIRYTGLSSTSLIGIPATGVGAITAAVAYNSTVTAPAMLTGVSGLVAPLFEGDDVYLVVQRDNATRQADLAAMVHAGPGIREEWVQDRRLSIAEARARADATLALRPLEDKTVRYRCRDTRTRAGKHIVVNLPAPTNVTGTFKIQSVTIDNFRPITTQQPTYTVTASSRHFNFEDWLRRIETSP